MKTYTVSSSAIAKIDVGGNLANVTYTGGKEYVYEIAEPDAWTAALEAEIAKPDGSVGRFVNRSIREDESLRVVVTAWTLTPLGGVPPLPPIHSQTKWATTVLRPTLNN